MTSEDKLLANINTLLEGVNKTNFDRDLLQGLIRKLIIADRERMIKAIETIHDEDELPSPKCPYKTCHGGVVKKNEDSGEYHCTKCGSEIYPEYASVEGTKLRAIAIIKGEEKG